MLKRLWYSLMPTMPVLPPAFALPLSLAVLAANGATASVTTRDGQTITGEVAKRREGEAVVIVTPAGEAILIPWEHVQSIDDGAPARDAEADEKPEPRPASPATHVVELAVSLGYAHAFGNVAGGGNGAVADYFGSEVPVGVEIGVTPSPRLFFGAYGRYAFASPGASLSAACDLRSATCSAFGMAAGLEGHYRFEPFGKIEPWVGLGFGYSLDQWKAESVVPSSTALPGGGAVTSRTVARGWDFARLMGGANYRLSSKLALGGFLEISLSKYMSTVTKIDGGNVPTFGGSFPDRSFHEWVTIGARGVWSP